MLTGIYLKLGKSLETNYIQMYRLLWGGGQTDSVIIVIIGVPVLLPMW